MQRIYLDNAATTPLAPEVFEVMKPYFTEHFGNPSSIYSFGRETKMAIERARKSVAKILNAHPGEIFFTSGGTESANTAINAAVCDLGCRHIITSPIEHHATLHCCEHTAHLHQVKLSYVKLDALGHIDLEHLKELLANSEERCVVALMHANNEIGNLLKVKAVGNLCLEHNAIFYCDTVQTVAHYPISLHDLPVHFVSAAGHKFHGPKGVGILYVREDITVKPFVQGGGQERNMRAGTENIYGIVGFAKALEMAMENYEHDSTYIQSLKDYAIEQFEKNLDDVKFNGDYKGSSLYTVLSVCLPKNEKSEMLLFNLDMAGICISGGSACSSGANAGSHVISALNNGTETNRVTIRVSFSKNNTKEEIDTLVAKVKELI